jgi:type IV secretory pathway VirB6-like protein
MNPSRQRALLRFVLLLLCCGLFFFPHAASASSTAGCANNDLSCDSCISGAVFTDTSFGQNLITGIFTIINNVIQSAAQQFYQNTIGSADYKQFITGTIIVYLAMYGAMIMFGIIPVKPYDASVRLIKIALVYSLIDTHTGWNFFLQWIGGPLLMMMNQMIVLFNNVGTGSDVTMPSTIPGIGTLNITAMAVIYPAITQVISIKFVIAIGSLLSLQGPEILVALILAWAMKDFVMMVIGALFTYIKAIVGLAFLFGIAPVFIIFILFEKTRQAFLGWLAQVISLTFQPVLLFAFLAFYIGLINNALNSIMGNASANISAPDYCYVKWFSFPGGLWDIYWWRPTDQYGVPIAGDYPAGTPPPISTFSALYFLLLCHLGNSFGQYIAALANDLSGGLGVAMSTAQNLGQFAQGGMGGRSLGGLASSAGSSSFKWFTRPGGPK